MIWFRKIYTVIYNKSRLYEGQSQQTHLTLMYSALTFDNFISFEDDGEKKKGKKLIRNIENSVKPQRKRKFYISSI